MAIYYNYQAVRSLRVSTVFPSHLSALCALPRCCCLSSLLCLSILNIPFFPLCASSICFSAGSERPQPVRLRPGIFLCPSSPTLSTNTLSLPGDSSAPRATTPPPPSTVRSDSALLRKSVSFTEDLLLAASGIVGPLCVIK